MKRRKHTILGVDMSRSRDRIVDRLLGTDIDSAVQARQAEETVALLQPPDLLNALEVCINGIAKRAVFSSGDKQGLIAALQAVGLSATARDVTSPNVVVLPPEASITPLGAVGAVDDRQRASVARKLEKRALVQLADVPAPESPAAREHLHVFDKPCRGCLLSDARIVSQQRAAQLVSGCLADDTHFTCHVASLVGKDVACPAFIAAHGERIAKVRIGRAIGRLRVVQQPPYPDDIAASHAVKRAHKQGA